MRYQKDANKNRQRDERGAPKGQITKKHVTAVDMKREVEIDREESETESQEEGDKSESSIASIRTKEILKDVDEIFYEDQEKIKT